MIENLQYSGYHPDFIAGYEWAAKFFKKKPTAQEVKAELKYLNEFFKSENTCHIYIAGAIEGLQYFANLSQLEASA
jgi:hypothetical protein